MCYCSESGVTAAAQLRQFHRVFIALRSGRADRDDGSGGGSGSGPFSPRSLLCWPDSALGKLSVRDQTSLTAGERLSRRVTRCSSGHPGPSWLRCGTLVVARHEESPAPLKQRPRSCLALLGHTSIRLTDQMLSHLSLLFYAGPDTWY